MNAGTCLAVAVVIASACSRQGASSVPSSNEPNQPAAASLGCKLDVRRDGPHLGLAFVLSNPTSQPRTLHYHQPFLQFSLRVLADGHALTVLQGDFDGPVLPAELLLPAGGSATLDTPVTLEFAVAATTADSFAWIIVSEPRAVELHATLRIEGESFPECVARVDRT